GNEISPGYLFLKARNSPLQETTVIVVGHKTDFVTFRFINQLDKTTFGCHLADFGFPQMTQRQFGPLQTILRNTPKYIALVLHLVYALGNHKALVFLAYIGVVPGGNKLAVEP